VAEIVRAHGGTIEVGDAPSGGASFSLHLVAAWYAPPRTFSASASIDALFSLNCLKKLLGERRPIRTGVAGHHDNNDGANACHHGEEIIPRTSYAEIVMLDVLKIVPSGLIPRKAQAHTLVWRFRRSLEIEQ
jgi:hypothetical protein